MRKQFITEKSLERALKSLLKESYVDYEESDYLEVFLIFFRKWLMDKLGPENVKGPLSYFLRKYLFEFVEDMKLTDSDIMRGINDRNSPIHFHVSRLSRIGQEIVKKGLHSLENLRPKEKFTEKYKRGIDVIIKSLSLPEAIQIIIKENDPYDVNFHLFADWEKLLRSETTPPSPGTIKRTFEKKLIDFMGIETGNPLHGKLNYTFDDKPHYVGFDEWLKSEFSKKIKSEIKKVRGGENINRIQFKAEVYKWGGELKIIFKGGWRRESVKQEVKNLISNLGYNTNILEVSY